MNKIQSSFGMVFHHEFDGKTTANSFAWYILPPLETGSWEEKQPLFSSNLKPKGLRILLSTTMLIWFLKIILTRLTLIYSTQDNFDLQGSCNSALISFLRLRCMSWFDARPWTLIFLNNFVQGWRPQTSRKITYILHKPDDLPAPPPPKKKKKLANNLLLWDIPNIW